MGGKGEGREGVREVGVRLSGWDRWGMVVVGGDTGWMDGWVGGMGGENECGINRGSGISR